MPRLDPGRCDGGFRVCPVIMGGECEWGSVGAGCSDVFGVGVFLDREKGDKVSLRGHVWFRGAGIC